MPAPFDHLDWTALGVAATVLVGILTLYFQLRGLNRQVESATYQQMIDTFNDFSKLLIDRPELVDIIYGKVDPYVPPADPMLKNQVDWAIGMRFGWFESVIIQRNRYGMSRAIADHWRSILKTELECPAMKAHWEKYHDYYHPDLRQEISTILG